MKANFHEDIDYHNSYQYLIHPEPLKDEIMRLKALQEQGDDIDVAHLMRLIFWDEFWDSKREEFNAKLFENFKKSEVENNNPNADT